MTVSENMSVSLAGRIAKMKNADVCSFALSVEGES
jgi:hypothetical protein